MGCLNLFLMDDSEDVRDLVSLALGPECSLRWASSVSEARRCLARDDFHLLLLDINLPDGNGFEFFRDLREAHRHKNTPVIFLTARTGVEDRVNGITLGADDYITKPFSAAELRARVQMRAEKEAKRSLVLRKENLQVHLTEQRANLLIDGQNVDLQLTPLEFRLLSLLLTHENQTFSRQELVRRLWGDGITITDRCIDTHVYALRKKLGERADWIESVYGRGYRLRTET